MYWYQQPKQAKKWSLLVERNLSSYRKKAWEIQALTELEAIASQMLAGKAMASKDHVFGLTSIC